MSASIGKGKPRGISIPSKNKSRKSRLARIKGGKKRWEQRRKEITPESWAAQGSSGGNATLRKLGRDYFKSIRLHALKKAKRKKK